MKINELTATPMNLKPMSPTDNVDKSQLGTYADITKVDGNIAGINGPLNINSLAASLGIKNVSAFSQAIGRLKNPPPGANITKILTMPQMAELATAFYLLLTDDTGKKAKVLNQIRQITTGETNAK
jgi:hypothetical protein